MRSSYFFILWCLAYTSTAQGPIGSIQNSQSKAFDLFQSGEYESVLQILKERRTQGLYEKYLYEMSLLQLGTEDTKNLEALVSDNPKHSLNTPANYLLGKYYFHENNFANSRKFLRSVDGSELSSLERSNYYFMRGYISMQNLEYKDANNYFDRSHKLAIGNSTKLAYYQGFIYYHLNEKEEALRNFEIVRKDEEFGQSANFFTAKIRQEKGEYDEAISIIQSELSDEISVTNSTFYQLIGESYAAQNLAAKASNYLEKAIELYPGKPSAALYYQAGVANFKLGLKKKAINYFIESGIKSGDYAHLSAFQLARLYVSSNEIEKALSAYIEASASSDPAIHEESLFKSGKLQTDQGNYSEGINYLKDYLVEFDDGKWKTEAQQILAEAYLRTSNFDQAISHLTEVGITTKSQESIYQKVSFQKAQQLFNDGQFDTSITWFRESLKYPKNSGLTNEANFSIAEAFFSLSNFDEAIRAYSSQRKPTKATFYGLGYSYYNLYQYEKARNNFEKFLQNGSTLKLREDAALRLADCYYATKSYDRALALYQKAVQKSPSAYLFYQSGLVSRELGNKIDAINSFESVLKFDDENLKDDAVFQMAQIKFEGAEFEQAEFHFGTLLSKYPSSPLVPEAHLNRAVCRTNLNKLNDARDDYEYILNNHLKSAIAFNAMLGLQELESKGVKVQDIEGAIEKYKLANPDNKSLEVIEFDFAKSQYFNVEYSLASESFKDFISEYPGSSYLAEAKYYLADSYYRNGNLEASKSHFSAIRTIKNELIGRVLSRLGDINYKLNNYEEAKEAWLELVSLGRTEKDTYNGRLGLMNTFFKNGEFEECMSTADEIIQADWKPLNAERNAILMKGKSNLKIGNSELASENFETIANSTDLISAEASYNLALLAFEAGRYKPSLDLLFDFNSRFGSYTDWIDKSYLLIAASYIEMNELFQAKATLRSIVQHSLNEQTKNTAQERLNAIENLSVEDSIINKQ